MSPLQLHPAGYWPRGSRPVPAVGPGCELLFPPRVLDSASAPGTVPPLPEPEMVSNTLLFATKSPSCTAEPRLPTSKRSMAECVAERPALSEASLRGSRAHSAADVSLIDGHDAQEALRYSRGHCGIPSRGTAGAAQGNICASGHRLQCGRRCTTFDKDESAAVGVSSSSACSSTSVRLDRPAAKVQGRAQQLIGAAEHCTQCPAIPAHLRRDNHRRNLRPVRNSQCRPWH